MTVKDLIEMLQDEDQNAEVYFGCDYGDYHHTQQALPVVRCNTEYISKEAYSRSGLGVYTPRDGDDMEGADELPSGLVLP